MQVRNIPKTASEDDVRSAVESAAVSVKSIVFEEGPAHLDKKTANVRLVPPPELATDVNRIAISTVSDLKREPVEIDGVALQFEGGPAQVQLYVGNLTKEWQDDAVFWTEMETYGPVERCFNLRNAAGESKVRDATL